MDPLERDGEATANGGTSDGTATHEAEPTRDRDHLPNRLAEALWRAGGTTELAEIAADEIRSAFGPRSSS